MLGSRVMHKKKKKGAEGVLTVLSSEEVASRPGTCGFSASPVHACFGVEGESLGFRVLGF